jgi:hypothetical protein
VNGGLHRAMLYDQGSLDAHLVEGWLRHWHPCATLGTENHEFLVTPPLNTNEQRTMENPSCLLCFAEHQLFTVSSNTCDRAITPGYSDTNVITILPKRFDANKASMQQIELNKDVVDSRSISHGIAGMMKDVQQCCHRHVHHRSDTPMETNHQMKSPTHFAKSPNHRMSSIGSDTVHPAAIDLWDPEILAGLTPVDEHVEIEMFTPDSAMVHALCNNVPPIITPAITPTEEQPQETDRSECRPLYRRRNAIDASPFRASNGMTDVK